MSNPLRTLVSKWSSEQDGDRFRRIDQTISFLEKRLYRDYEPEAGNGFDFFVRLNNWLANCENENEQKHFFELVPKLFFIGRSEFEVLYRTAYNSHIARWIFNKSGLLFNDRDIEQKLELNIKNTWICPISDSLRINQFHHLNSTPSRFEYRPDWRSLSSLGSEEKLRNYVTKEKIEGLVLIEDFVGSGTQMSKAIEFAATTLSDIEILVVPLVICPEGEKKALKISKKYENVKIAPVLKIPDGYFITDFARKGETTFVKKIRAIVQKYHMKSGVGKGGYYKAFGFKNTGGLVVMHTNIPNNSLPILYWESNWSALFKRHNR